MKRVLVLVFSFVLLLLIIAQKSNACDQLNYWSSDDITLAMSTKLARGITNVATGWMELPRSFYVTGQDDGIAKSIFIGPFKGLFMTATRTLIGAIEVGTFLVPAPGCYSPFLDRPLVWSDVHQEKGLLIFNKDRSDRKYYTPAETKSSDNLQFSPAYEHEVDVDHEEKKDNAQNKDIYYEEERSTDEVVEDE